MDESRQSGAISRTMFCSRKEVVKSNKNRRELDTWKSSSSTAEGKTGCVGAPEGKWEVLAGSALKFPSDCFNFLSVKI